MLKDAIGFYDKLKVDSDVVQNILILNYNKLDSISDIDLSKYCIILSQYIIYFKWQFNKTKADLMILKNKMESVLFHIMTPEIIKKYSTKTEAKHRLINDVPALIELQQQIDKLEYELFLADGLDKPVQEFINVLKKEQSRRENELVANRYERR